MATDSTTILAAALAVNNLGLGYLFIKRTIVTGAELARAEAQIDAKDGALQRKDEQIQALNKGLVDTAIPAITRATSILEHFHTDTTVRRSD